MSILTALPILRSYNIYCKFVIFVIYEGVNIIFINDNSYITIYITFRLYGGMDIHDRLLDI